MNRLQDALRDVVTEARAYCWAVTDSDFLANAAEEVLWQIVQRAEMAAAFYGHAAVKARQELIRRRGPRPPGPAD